MEQIDKLLNKKMMLLDRILQLTQKISLTENEEENGNTLIKLMEERKEIFSEIRVIDTNILNINENAILTNNTILDLRDEIVNEDKKIQQELEKVKKHYASKIKEVKMGRKMTNHFNTNMFSSGSHFDSQG